MESSSRATTSSTTTTTMYSGNGFNNGHNTLPAIGSNNVIRRSNNNNNTNNNNNHHSTEVNGNTILHNNNNNNGNHRDSKFEVPLPFGYHMDLDFLRFCSDDKGTDETLDRLKDLRRMRRNERKTLEAIMGLRQDRSRSKTLSPTRETSSLTIHHPATPGNFLKNLFVHLCYNLSIEPVWPIIGMTV